MLNFKQIFSQTKKTKSKVGVINRCTSLKRGTYLLGAQAKFPTNVSLKYRKHYFAEKY